MTERAERALDGRRKTEDRGRKSEVVASEVRNRESENQGIGSNRLLKNKVIVTLSAYGSVEESKRENSAIKRVRLL